MATFDEILSGGGVTAVSGVDSVQGIETLIPKKLIPEVDGGSDSGFTFSPTTSATGTTMGFQDLGGMVLGGILSAINPVLGAAYSLVNPNSITRQVLGSIGFNPVTEGSIDNPIDNQIDVEAIDRDQAGDMGPSQAQSEANMSEGMTDLADGGIVRKKYADGGLNYLMGY